MNHIVHYVKGEFATSQEAPEIVHSMTLLLHDLPHFVVHFSHVWLHIIHL